VRHISLAYGQKNLIVRNADGSVHVPHKGVVLIDEVDAHLHPEWQRIIGFWLKSHFPNIQFIVTSHSAFVCQAADELGLYRLPSATSGDLPHRLSKEVWGRVISGTPDSILTSDAFGLDYTRSPVAVRARSEWSRLRAKSLTSQLNDAEKSRMEQLELFAGDSLDIAQ
jgi:hypothetical protein